PPSLPEEEAHCETNNCAMLTLHFFQCLFLHRKHAECLGFLFKIALSIKSAINSIIFRKSRSVPSGTSILLVEQQHSESAVLPGDCKSPPASSSKEVKLW